MQDRILGVVVNGNEVQQSHVQGLAPGSWQPLLSVQAGGSPEEKDFGVLVDGS